MTLSTAATAVVGALCLINTMLMLAVIRRLNEQGRLLAERGTAPAPGLPPPLAVEPGQRVGDFTATSLEGVPVSREDLSGTTLMAFMAPGCPSCELSVPDFLARAGSEPGGRDNVLAVVLGKGLGRDELCEELAPVARVLTEEAEGGPLVTAFGVGMLPAFAVLSGDVVVGSYAEPDRIPVP